MTFLKQLSTHQAGILAVVVAAILWSTGGLFIKLLPFDPFTILFYRSAIAALLFGYICRRKLFAINRKNIIAILFYTALLVSFVVATKMTTAANAIFLQYTAPIYVLLMEPLLFRLKLQRINVLTILICIAGMLLFFIGDFQVGNMGGNALALLSGICLAGFMLTQRVNAPDKQEVSIFWGNVAVALVGRILRNCAQHLELAGLPQHVRGWEQRARVSDAAEHHRGRWCCHVHRSSTDGFLSGRDDGAVHVGVHGFS